MQRITLCVLALALLTSPGGAQRLGPHYARGGELASLAPQDLHDLLPGIVSPNGRYLVYARKEVGSIRLHLVDFATGRRRVLTPGAGARREMVWSHDSRMIAYWGEVNRPGRIERRHGIGVVDVISGIERTVYDVTDSSSGTFAFMPAWTRDGRIVFYQLQSQNLMLVDPRTGVARVLRRGGDIDEPRVSPDGRQLSFAGAGCAGGRRSGIRVLTLADTLPSRCLVGDVNVIDNLGWSADGRTLYVFGSIRPQETPAVLAIDASGKGVRRFELPRVPGKPVRARMQSNGAIVLVTHQSFLRVGTVPVTGGVPVILQSDSGDTSWPLWSHDGTRIAALSGQASMRQDSGVVAQFDATGPTRGSRIVDAAAEEVARMAVSPDGRCFYTRSGGVPLRPASYPRTSYGQSPPVYGRTDSPTRMYEHQQSAQWSADGAFVLAQGGASLFAIRRDSSAGGACRAAGTEPVVLKGLGEEVIKGFPSVPLNPRLSPDGKSIALSRQPEGRMVTLQTNPEPVDTPAVLVVPIGGGDVQTLRLLPRDASYGGPDWSSDGTALYFADVTADGIYRIHKLIVATGAVEVITQGRRGAVHPRVSPDGTTLAVTIFDSRSTVWRFDLRR